MDGVVEAFSVDVLKAKKLVNIGEDVRLRILNQHNRYIRHHNCCCRHNHHHHQHHHETALEKM